MLYKNFAECKNSSEKATEAIRIMHNYIDISYIEFFYAKVTHFSAHFGFNFNIFLNIGQVSAWQPGK